MNKHYYMPHYTRTKTYFRAPADAFKFVFEELSNLECLNTAKAKEEILELKRFKDSITGYVIAQTILASKDD